MDLFEEKLETINRLITLKKSFWKLTHLLGFEDVRQIILIHFSKKMHGWIPEKGPFEGWAMRLITNQMKNLMRNYYYKLAPPCVSIPCPASGDGDVCTFTPSGVKCAECKLYKKWEASRKIAYELQKATTLEDYDVSKSTPCDFDMIKSVEKFHQVMEKVLTPRMFSVYKCLYIDGLSDEDTAKKLGFKTKEARCPGYRQIGNIKSKIYEAAKKAVEDFDLAH